MSSRLRIVLICGLLLLAAAWFGWMFAGSNLPKTEAPAPKQAAVTPKAPPVKPPGWVPPEGQPVQRYEEGKTADERYEIMGSFMTLGHEQNPFMLIRALKDESLRNRVSAVEYAAQLQEQESAEVLKEAILNDQKDVREMAWSLLAPHPVANKAPVFMAAIERGSDTTLEESFSEMGRTPETPLFEAMLTSAARVQGPRQARVFKELLAWMEPGGGERPAFKSVAELTTWWAANKQRYDQYMLRVDQ